MTPCLSVATVRHYTAPDALNVGYRSFLLTGLVVFKAAPALPEPILVSGTFICVFSIYL